MGQSLAEQAEQITTALQLHARLTAEGDAVLRSLQEKLSQLNLKLAPIHERATALTWAEENITLAKAETQELLQHIDASRKVESVLRLGPGRDEAQLEQFLAAVGQLEEAISHLEAYMDGGNVNAVEQAYDTALDLYEKAMRDCEVDFASVLAQHGAARLPSAAWLTEKAAPEHLRESLSHPELELLPPAAIGRVSRLAEAMLRARHVTCLDSYAQARSRSLDMLLALVGLDLSSLPSGLALQSADQLHRLVASWAVQLRVLLVGAAAELALAQDVWQSPYDEVTFSETISRCLRLVLQVGKAVCEGRGVSKSPDRVFVLLQMHQSLMELLPYLDDLLSARERCTGLLNEAHLLGVMIGRSARQLFADFEEGVGSRGLQGAGAYGPEAVSKLTMLDGTVHPICATTLSFLKRLFTYPNALSLLFFPGGAGSVSSAGGGASEAAAAAASSSIMRILMRLLEALESKARSYKIPALGDLFLMNNVHYMVWTVEQAAAADKQVQQAQKQQPGKSSGQAVEGGVEGEIDGGGGRKRRGGRGGGNMRGSAPSGESRDGATDADGENNDDRTVSEPGGGGGGGSSPAGLGVLGIAWVERHKDIVEHYGASYHEKTWRPLISSLEAVLVTEEDVEPSEPGRFKTWLKSKFAKINTQLDTILKQQSTWTIPDAKLKSAVRSVIKQDLLPLYGEFWDRYTAFDFTTHPDKYLRYPPEQLGFLINHSLFEGRAAAPRSALGAGAGGGGNFPPPPLSHVSSSRSSLGPAGGGLATTAAASVRGGAHSNLSTVVAAVPPAAAGGRAKNAGATGRRQ